MKWQLLGHELDKENLTIDDKCGRTSPLARD
jgi:hypothetical protein